MLVDCSIMNAKFSITVRVSVEPIIITKKNKMKVKNASQLETRKAIEIFFSGKNYECREAIPIYLENRKSGKNELISWNYEIKIETDKLSKKFLKENGILI